MIFQISPERLLDYLDYFEGIEYLRNLLVNISFNKTGFVITDNEKDPTLILCSPSPTAWIWFLTGDFSSLSVREILSKIPEKKGILVPLEDEQEWLSVFKQNWENVSYFTRTAMSAKALKIEYLRKVTGFIPKEYTLVEIHQNEMDYIAKNWEGWDKMENYKGYCIKKGEKVVSVAIGSLNPVRITKSLEIAIQTVSECQGQGLATVVGSKLIEYCLVHDIEPQWNAANDISQKLSVKLGYTNPEPYNCYYWWKTNNQQDGQ